MGPHVAVSVGSSHSRRLAVSLGELAANRFPANLELAAHSHPTTTVAVILAGGFAGTYRAGERECGSRTIVIEPAGEQHRNRFGGGDTTILTLSLASERLAGSVEAAARRFRHAIDPYAALIARRAARELERPDDVTPLAVESAALELIARVARTSRPERRPTWLTEARAVLHDRYAESLSLAEIGAVVGVEPGRVARGFRRAFGEPVASYLRRVRVDVAARLLATTDTPISTIAADVGFADQSHLTRCFGRYLGMSPGRYRAEQRPRREAPGRHRPE